MVLVIIYCVAKTRRGRDKMRGEAGKSAGVRILHRRDRPKPVCQFEFFGRRIMDRQHAVAGFENISQRTLNLKVAMQASPKLSELVSLKMLRTT